jgi:ribosomal protein S27AE
LRLILWPLRLAWWVLSAWNIGLFMKKCPQCGHMMDRHQRRDDGSFKD